MNKILNINLGGYPFTIDDDAYDHLCNYIETIEHHFNDSEGCDEIISDIETRMAELFREGMDSRPIVTKRDVENAVKIMGTPQEFGADPIEEKIYASEAASKITKSGKKYKTGKRLFRNPDEKVVGGVASGIAEYMGLSDPLWVRLVFVFVLLFGGLALPAYILLWILVPEAKSSSDRLAMKGERINVSNIAKMVEEEIDEIGEKIHHISEKGSKKKAKIKILIAEESYRKGFLF